MTAQTRQKRAEPKWPEPKWPDQKWPEQKWKVDRSVPVALMLGMLVQTGGVVWWAATTSSRIDALEKTQVTAERVARIEEQSMSLREAVFEIKADIKRLLDKKS